MATLMQKDVLIELIATIQAKFALSLGVENLNKDQLFLAELRNFIYRTEPKSLDYPSISQSIHQISKQYQKVKNTDIDLDSYDVASDVEVKFPLIWANLLAESSIHSTVTPSAILLGGQPGAGKSQGSKQALERLNNNVLIINGDEFRPYHQYFDEIYAKYGNDFSKYTGDFSGKMVEKIRDEAIKQRFNIIIEGTFRRADLPLRELANFIQHGYRVGVIICTCPAEISWESTLERAKEQQFQGLNPRYVPREHHDLVVSKLAENVASVIRQNPQLEYFEIYSRDNKVFDLGSGNQTEIQTVIENILRDNR